MKLIEAVQKVHLGCEFRRKGCAAELLTTIARSLCAALALGGLGLSLSPAQEGKPYKPANRIYWVDAATRKIQRANLDGSAVQDLLTGLSEPQYIALDLDGGKMYWGEVTGSMKVRRANLDGSGVEDLVQKTGATEIALDVAAGKMYWADAYISGGVLRANLDGTDVQEVAPFGADREGLAVDAKAGKLYWTDRGSDIIQRANTDGSNLETLVATGLKDPRGIALDLVGGKMYWAEAGLHMIQRSRLDGSKVEDLVAGLMTPDGIALDLGKGKMYWTDFEAHKIQRANLDGSEVEDIVTGLSIPVGIALESLPTLINVNIDIKPGAPQNTINPWNSGLITVAILSTSRFNAWLQVDPASLSFGATGGEAAVKFCDPQPQDMNGDALPDLVCHFSTRECGFEIEDKEGIITGRTLDGIPLVGSDSVRIVGSPFSNTSGGHRAYHF